MSCSKTCIQWRELGVYLSVNVCAKERLLWCYLCKFYNISMLIGLCVSEAFNMENEDGIIYINFVVYCRKCEQLLLAREKWTLA